MILWHGVFSFGNPELPGTSLTRPRWEIVAKTLELARSQGIEPELTLAPDPGELSAYAFHGGPQLLLGAKMGFYTREYVCFFYVESGGGPMHVGGRTINLERGDLLLLPPHHRMNHDDFRPTERDRRRTSFWSVGFGQTEYLLGDSTTAFRIPLVDALAAFPRIEGTMASLVRIPADAQTTWVEHCADLHAAIYSSTFDRDARIRALFALMYGTATRACGAPLIQPPANSLVLAAISFIQNSAHHHRVAEHVSAHVSRSMPYLKKLVLECTGLSLSAWVERKRVQDVERSLLRTRDSLAAIAEKTGFDDERELLRCFEQVHGLGPLAFREVHRDSLRITHDRRVTFLAQDMTLIAADPP